MLLIAYVLPKELILRVVNLHVYQKTTTIPLGKAP